MALLGLALLLAAASPPSASRDLPAIRSARSIVAEWALVNRTAAEGRVTQTYVRVMRTQARRQLEAQFEALSDPGSAAGRLIADCLRLPGDAPYPLLEARSRRLRAIGAQVEAA